MSKVNLVLKAFKNGEELTAKQISARFKLIDPHSTIRTLRNSGYAIYLNKRTNSLGETYNKYRLGTPTRQVIAAGIAALGAEAAGLV